MNYENIFADCNTGVDFEYRIVDIFTLLGFKANKTGSNDGGIDIIVEGNINETEYKYGANSMSRPMRATARLARCLWELSRSGIIRVNDIYRQMAFGNQTDKEFSVNGLKWKRYVTSDRTTRPILPSTVVNEIIEDGYIQRLSPERRFDQTLYFTVQR